MSMKLTQNDFDRLVVFMKKNYGINLEKKSVLIEGRLSNMIAQRGFKSFKDYLDSAGEQADHQPYLLFKRAGAL